MPEFCRIHRCPAIVLSAALLAVLTGCATQSTRTPAAVQTWTRETLAIGRVSLEVPDGWTLSEAVGSAMLSPRPPEADDAAVLVTPGRFGVTAIDTARTLLPLRDVNTSPAAAGARGMSGSATLDGVGAVRFEVTEVDSSEGLVLLVVRREGATADHVAALQRIVASVRVTE